MHGARFGIAADVRFHPKIPLVALFGLVHLGASLAALVLGGGRGSDDGRIHHGAFSHLDSAFAQHKVDFFEDSFAEVVTVEQMSEIEHGRFIRHPVVGEVDAGEIAHRLAVVERVFDGFVAKVIPALQEMDAQHLLQADGRRSALAFGIVRLDERPQPRPRDGFFHVGEELFPLRGFLFSGVFGCCKAQLFVHCYLFLA